MAKEQTAKAATTTVKKATVTTETILGKAALKLEAGVKALADAGEELTKLAETSSDLTLKIAQQEGELEALKDKFAEEQRSGKVELQNALKEDAKALVNKVLAENGLVSIAKEELEATRAELNKLKNDFNKEKEAAVNAAVSIKTKEFESAKELYEAQAKAASADTQAQVKNLEDKVSFLEDQNESLLLQLDKAGERAVSIAQASSVGTINLGTEGKR